MHPSHAWAKVVHGACCDAARLEQLLSTELVRASVLRILGAPPVGEPRRFWSRVAAAIGSHADLSEYGGGSDWVDSGFEPNGRAASRGDGPQPLHNDCAAAPALDDTIGAFHVERPAPGAGRILFVDAGQVAAAARRRDPSLHDRLFGAPVRFGRSEREVRVSPILRRVGERLKIAWNPFRVLADQSAAARDTVAAFRLFLEDLVLSGEAAAMPLGAGDVIFFRADEVLHGREPPTPRHTSAALLAKAFFVPEGKAGMQAA